jgi:hypothetical protein
VWTLHISSRVKITAFGHSVEDDCLQTDERSASSGMDAIDHHELLRGPSVGTVTFPLQYRVSFSTDLALQLKL